MDDHRLRGQSHRDGVGHLRRAWRRSGCLIRLGATDIVHAHPRGYDAGLPHRWRRGNFGRRNWRNTRAAARTCRRGSSCFRRRSSRFWDAMRCSERLHGNLVRKLRRKLIMVRGLRTCSRVVANHAARGLRTCLGLPALPFASRVLAHVTARLHVRTLQQTHGLAADGRAVAAGLGRARPGWTLNVALWSVTIHPATRYVCGRAARLAAGRLADGVADLVALRGIALPRALRHTRA